MKQLLAAAAILIPACTRTVVDVGAAGDGLVDGGTPTSSRWMSNENNCPESAPSHLEACTVREAQSCVYWADRGFGVPLYHGCTCYEENRSSKLWTCESSTDRSTSACPRVQPENQQSCLGHVGLQCPFPGVLCSCPLNDSDPGWSCIDRNAGPPTAPTAGPSTVPETKQIKDLSDAEARSWCEWFLTAYGAGFAPPEEGPISPDGFATNHGYANGTGFYAPVCMPTKVPVNYCVANLKLAPCEGTVAELSDCVLTVVRGAPAVHGCGRFLQAAYCEQTIFHRNSAFEGGPAGCGTLKVR
jgi:hypothetical protein